MPSQTRPTACCRPWCPDWRTTRGALIAGYALTLAVLALRQVALRNAGTIRAMGRARAAEHRVGALQADPLIAPDQRPGQSVPVPVRHLAGGLVDAGEPDGDIPGRSDPATQFVVGQVAEIAKNGMPPSDIAEVVHAALTASKPKTRYLVGKAAKQRARAAAILPDRVFDRLVARTLKWGAG